MRNRGAAAPGPLLGRAVPWVAGSNKVCLGRAPAAGRWVEGPHAKTQNAAKRARNHSCVYISNQHCWPGMENKLDDEQKHERNAKNWREIWRNFLDRRFKPSK